ncbi:hypothetical protein, partial [Enterococcus faecium]|uniref:hypothetical protein n=1 Tax=Enterococcus faecium TaxID=1352 RepID=UPI003CC6DB63
MTEVSNHLPALTIEPTESLSIGFNGKQVFVTEDSQIILEKNFTEKQKVILEDYRQIQYELVAGNQYSAT